MNINNKDYFALVIVDHTPLTLALFFKHLSLGCTDMG